MSINSLKDMLCTGVRESKFELDNKLLNLLTEEISIDTDGGIYLSIFVPENKLTFPDNLVVKLGENKFVCTNLINSHVETYGSSESHNIAKFNVYLTYESIVFNENIH